MPANYLHGVETTELNIGPRPVTVVKSAVIGLIGVSPIGPKNTLTLVQSPADASQFGAIVPNFNIPQALDAIQKQGAGTVLVVNVFDPTANTDAVTETKDVEDGKFSLTDAPNYDGSNTLALTNGESGGDLVTYTLNTDYKVDDFGNVTIVPGGAISEGDTVTCIYRKFDPTSVNNSQLIGALTSGVRTGMKVFDLAFSTFGFNPRLLICPGYTSIKAITAELLVYADRFRGHVIVDSVVGDTVTAAIADRADITSSFGTSSKRAILTYPRLKAYDPATDASAVVPYSSFLAGVIAATDNTDGYWFSPSNREIKGITGVERIITASVNDATTEANLFNEKGIVTIFNSFGTGLRTWGNRSAAFPTSTAPSNFIAVQRTADILHESLELAMLQFIDLPLNNALIDAIRDTVNSFIRTLIQRGAIIDGECTYDPAKNPPTEIAAGHVTFDIVFMPPTPAERITFESFIDINLLRTLGSNQ
jgi:phage tail sheath protein FI